MSDNGQTRLGLVNSEAFQGILNHGRSQVQLSAHSVEKDLVMQKEEIALVRGELFVPFFGEVQRHRAVHYKYRACFGALPQPDFRSLRYAASDQLTEPSFADAPLRVQNPEVANLKKTSVSA